MDNLSSEDSGGEKLCAGTRVLVVDDDHITLKVLENMLTTCKYKVVAVTRPTDALNVLYEKQGGFDIVLTDVHMPIMNGFELLSIIRKDFKIPVIMISADGNIDSMAKGMQCGATSYIIKPIVQSSIQNLWQFVLCKEPPKQVVDCQRLLDVRANVQMASSPEKNNKQEDIEYSSSINVKNHNRRENKRVRSREMDEEEEESESRGPQKKARMVWTTNLHERFVAAVNQIGLKKAVPKKILEVMNVNGVSRTNIASHLQKYRLFIKGNKDPSNFGDSMYFGNKVHTVGYLPGLTQVFDQGSLANTSMAQAKYGTRSIFNDRNIQQQYMSTISNLDHFGQKNIEPFKDTNFGDHLNNSSSYKTNFVGLQLSNREGMIGLRKTSLNGGITSNININVNNMNGIQYGKQFWEESENNHITHFDVMNSNDVAQVETSSHIVENPNQFQEISQTPIVEEHQYGSEFENWFELLKNDSTKELSYLHHNEENQNDQDSGIEGLIMDPQFSIGEFQLDDNYPTEM